jgi:hypothetical protein
MGFLFLELRLRIVGLEVSLLRTVCVSLSCLWRLVQGEGPSSCEFESYSFIQLLKWRWAKDLNLRRG